MRTTIRFFLLWVMMLAIPIQGIAASAMLHCGPNHAEQAPFYTAVVDHVQHGHAGQSGAHEDITAAGSFSAASGDDADSDSRSTDVTKLGKFKCSACASCCSAVAILHSVAAISVVEIVFDRDASPVADRPGFVTDGPERPPRIALG